MNPNVFALSEDMTVGEAIRELQTNRDVEMVFYLYVVDERRHLVGVVSLRRLLLVSPETPLKRIMTSDLISARADMDQEEVARQVAAYNLLAIPVVDEENKLVGIITVDDVIDVIKDEATEDVYRLAGVSKDDGVLTPPFESLRRRAVASVNLVTAFRLIGRRRLQRHHQPGRPLRHHAGRCRHGRQCGDSDPGGHRAKPVAGRVDLVGRVGRIRKDWWAWERVALGIIATLGACPGQPLAGLVLGLAMVTTFSLPPWAR
jgi:CBS-domain-containing membrane protein